MKELNEQLTNIEKIAEYLGEATTASLTQKLQHQWQKKRLYLPIIGQFSAGKSNFINNLLGCDLLPMKRTETTAILTYIEYASTESATLETDEGNVPLSMEDVRKLHHEAALPHGLPKSKIRCLRIRKNHPLLAKDVVLVDTPGINTLVNEHEAITFDFLEESCFLVYVFAKQPTSMDAKTLEHIHRLGIKMIFIRTHIDEIKEQEENLEDSLKNDQKILSKLVGDSSLEYFAISNLLSDAKWQPRFSRLAEHFSGNIASRGETFLRESIESRLMPIKAKLAEHLERKQNLLQSNLDCSVEAIQEKLDALQRTKELALRQSLVVQGDIKNKSEALKQTIKQQSDSILRESVTSFDDELFHYSQPEKLQQEIPAICDKFLTSAVDALGAYSQKQIADWQKNSCLEFQNSVGGIFDDLKTSAGVDLGKSLTQLDLQQFMEESQERKRLLSEIDSVKQFLEQSDEELAQHGITRSEVQEKVNALKSVISECQRERDALGEYVPQYTEVPGDNAVSDGLGRLGQLTDILLILGPILFPPAAPVAAATAGAKLAAGAKTVAQVAKTVSLIDKTKNLIKTVTEKKDEIASKVKSALEAKKTGILDVFSLESHLRNFGKLFDSNRKKVVDQEYKEAFQRKKNEIESNLNAQKSKELQLRIAEGKIQDKEKMLQIEQNLKAKYAKELEEQLQYQQEEMQRKSFKKFKEELVRSYTEHLKTTFSKAVNLLQKAIDSLYNDIVESATRDIVKKATDAETDLANLQEQKRTNESAISQQLAEIQGYRNLIGGTFDPCLQKS